MDHMRLAELLFPNINKDPRYFEALYPPRDLPAGAKVTRLGPSPTGFIHLGNLYGAFADERLAHQSKGVFILRIEDTDNKREVAGAVETIISSLEYFGVHFDEGATHEGDKGYYGPYRQRQRAEIYQTFAKLLVQQGKAYPCFCTEAELAEIREQQAELKVNFGYYGSWAKHRNLTIEEIQARLDRGEPFVIRLKSQGDPSKYFTIEDGIRGRLSMPENDQDVVLLKADGIPTYHFAHVIDDHFMRVTHILRGEEWLSTLPYHIEIFQALGWSHPVFCHTTVLMKMDEGIKRKLSKRKDPELGLDYYRSLGYHPTAVREYLLTVLNSNFEEWRLAHPEAPVDEFEFTTEKMGSSGALFDLDKLKDVSKDVFANMTAAEVLEFMQAWARQYQPELAGLFAENQDYLLKVLSIGRGGEKPRKDLIYATQIFEFIKFFFDEYFVIEDAFPDNVASEEAQSILGDYLAGYDYEDDNTTWFEKVRKLAEKHGFAAKPKDYKKNPAAYKGHVGDVSAVIRVALSGRRDAPDLWEIQQIMGLDRVRSRIQAAQKALQQQ
jgi:glutamyl-tRNA synthetase